MKKLIIFVALAALTLPQSLTPALAHTTTDDVRTQNKERIHEARIIHEVIMTDQTVYLTVAFDGRKKTFHISKTEYHYALRAEKLYVKETIATGTFELMFG